MEDTLSKYKYRDPVLGAVLLAAGCALALCPDQSMDAARQGLQLCANVIVPSLFPFFVLSALVVELGLARYLGRALEGLMWPLFRVSGVGASALVLGLVGGYPVGARTAIGLYEKGLLSRTQAQRLLAFCNNSGPAFILGVVGAGVFGSGRVGLFLYLTHIAASLCVGLLFRFHGKEEIRPAVTRRAAVQFQATRFSTALTDSVKGSCLSVLNICAFVVFFAVVIRLLTLTGIIGMAVRLLTSLGLDPALVHPLLTGFLELSSGVVSLTQADALTGRIAMAAFILGWAGLCVHCQVLSFFGNSDLSPAPYLLGKALHGLFSALLAGLLARFLPPAQPVSGCLIPQAGYAPLPTAGGAPALRAGAAWLLCLLFLALTVYAARKGKKRGGKVRKYAL